MDIKQMLMMNGRQPTAEDLITILIKLYADQIGCKVNDIIFEKEGATNV